MLVDVEFPLQFKSKLEHTWKKSWPAVSQNFRLSSSKLGEHQLINLTLAENSTCQRVAINASFHFESNQCLFAILTLWTAAMSKIFYWKRRWIGICICGALRNVSFVKKPSVFIVRRIIKTPLQSDLRGS